MINMKKNCFCGSPTLFWGNATSFQKPDLVSANRDGIGIGFLGNDIWAWFFKASNTFRKLIWFLGYRNTFCKLDLFCRNMLFGNQNLVCAKRYCFWKSQIVFAKCVWQLQNRI
jgi:hypothetical protein